VFGVDEKVGDFGEIRMGCRQGRRSGEAHGFQVSFERVEEAGNAGVADVLD